MIEILIEDTARNNLVSWTTQAIAAKRADGAVLNAFCSPSKSTNYKPSPHVVAKEIQEKGGTAWFMPMTYAAQIPGAADFQHYETWNLWSGRVGDLEDRESCRRHVASVFTIQADLEVPLLSPSNLLHSPTGGDAHTYLELLNAASTSAAKPSAVLAGTPSFWASNSDLDAFIGTIAEFDIERWFLVVVRSSPDMPAAWQEDDIAGMCRTVRALSEVAHVHLPFGDFGSLPAIAAGGASLGTGWDTRGKICAETIYGPRTDSDGGQWLKRPSVEGLLGYVARTDIARLFAQDPALGRALFTGGLHPDAPKESFNHHLDVLNSVAGALPEQSHEARYDAVNKLYDDARKAWDTFATTASARDDSDKWIDPLQSGLKSYGRAEGW